MVSTVSDASLITVRCHLLVMALGELLRVTRPSSFGSGLCDAFAFHSGHFVPRPGGTLHPMRGVALPVESISIPRSTTSSILFASVPGTGSRRTKSENRCASANFTS